MTTEFKSRSKIFFSQMSDDVAFALDKKSAELCISKWLIAEKILESALGIDKKIDLNEWLGVSRSRGKIGTPFKKKATK